MPKTIKSKKEIQDQGKQPLHQGSSIASIRPEVKLLDFSELNTLPTTQNTPKTPRRSVLPDVNAKKYSPANLESGRKTGNPGSWHEETKMPPLTGKKYGRQIF